MTLAAARKRLDSNEVDMVEALQSYKSKLTVRRMDHIDQLLKPLHCQKVTASRSQLVALLQTKAKTSPVMANRMLTRWKDFFNFCEQQGWVEHNPLAIVQRKFIGGKEQSRDRVLNWEEIASLQHPVLLYMLLTGLRTSEALWSLRHKKHDNIPTKTTLHSLPNTRLIRWALRQQITVPASHLTLSNYLRRKGSTYTPHDLRRTFATRLSDLGTPPFIVEKMLNHKMIGVMGVYNHAEYWPERHAAQLQWERELLKRRRASKSAPSASASPGTSVD
jgi:integrase